MYLLLKVVIFQPAGVNRGVEDGHFLGGGGIIYGGFPLRFSSSVRPLILFSAINCWLLTRHSI